MSVEFNPTELARRDTDRMKGYRKLLDFYHSVQWEGREKWGERRLTFNYAKVVVDKVTSYLMSGIGFAVEPEEESDGARAKAQKSEAALRTVYDANSMKQLDFDTEIDCAILGDACYKVIWDQETGSVRVTAPDIQGIYTWRLGDDSSRIWRVASRYTLNADSFRSNGQLLYVALNVELTLHVEVKLEGVVSRLPPGGM